MVGRRGGNQLQDIKVLDRQDRRLYIHHTKGMICIRAGKLHLRVTGPRVEREREREGRERESHHHIAHITSRLASNKRGALLVAVAPSLLSLEFDGWAHRHNTRTHMRPSRGGFGRIIYNLPVLVEYEVGDSAGGSGLMEMAAWGLNACFAVSSVI